MLDFWGLKNSEDQFRIPKKDKVQLFEEIVHANKMDVLKNLPAARRVFNGKYQNRLVGS